MDIELPDASGMEVQLIARRLGHACQIGGRRHGPAVLHMALAEWELSVCDSCARHKFSEFYARARRQGFRRP